MHLYEFRKYFSKSESATDIGATHKAACEDFVILVFFEVFS